MTLYNSPSSKILPSRRKSQKCPGGRLKRRHVSPPATGGGGMFLPPQGVAGCSFRHGEWRDDVGPTSRPAGRFDLALAGGSTLCSHWWAPRRHSATAKGGR